MSGGPKINRKYRNDALARSRRNKTRVDNRMRTTAQCSRRASYAALMTLLMSQCALIRMPAFESLRSKKRCASGTHIEAVPHRLLRKQVGRIRWSPSMSKDSGVLWGSTMWGTLAVRHAVVHATGRTIRWLPDNARRCSDLVDDYQLVGIDRRTHHLTVAALTLRRFQHQHQMGLR